jgi:hypothetical protein
MANKILFFFLLFTMSCGREVKISNNQLEKYSNVTMPDALTVSLNGTLIRNTPAQLSTQGKLLNISPYSSISAMNFINSLHLGSQTSVRFRGEVRGQEIVLTIIEKQ